VSQRAAPTVVLPPPILDADIVIEDDRWGADAHLVDAAQAAVAALVAHAPRGLVGASTATILLSDDAHITRLNTNFRGKLTPTNVLSFPAGPDATAPGEPVYLGDVIIAHETVVREASEQHISLAHHLQHLTIHGLLHLLGFDHETDADATVMEALETRVLASLGVADPYA
jgi:probable rRNA maturation factor